MSWQDILKEDGLPQEYSRSLNDFINNTNMVEPLSRKIEEARGKIFDNITVIENFIGSYNFRLPANKQLAQKHMKYLLENWKYSDLEDATNSAKSMMESITEVLTNDMKGEEANNSYDTTFPKPETWEVGRK